MVENIVYAYLLLVKQLKDGKVHIMGLHGKNGSTIQSFTTEADTTKCLIDIEFGSYSCGLLFNGKGVSSSIIYQRLEERIEELERQINKKNDIIAKNRQYKMNGRREI